MLESMPNGLDVANEALHELVTKIDQQSDAILGIELALTKDELVESGEQVEYWCDKLVA